MRWPLTALIVAVAIPVQTTVGSGQTRPQDDRLRVLELLDRYERGNHEAVVAELAAVSDIAGFAREVQRRVEGWTRPAQASPTTIERRRVVAAVFVLEMAAAHLDTDWGSVRYTVEWACELIRRGRATPVERVWHLAVVALAGGARDEQLLAYFPPYSSPDPIVRNRFSSFVHAAHAARRFPDEIRFRFAETFASGLPGLEEPQRDTPLRLGRHEKDTGEAAIRNLRRFVSDPVVGPEAHLRIGHLYYCLGNSRDATLHYQAALQAARDPFVVYLAHFFTGRMSEASGRQDEAADAYRRALAAMPHVQSATMALAARLFLDEKPSEAYELLNTARVGTPRPPDPWRLYGYGDYRFWPDLIGQLRERIRP